MHESHDSYNKKRSIYKIFSREIPDYINPTMTPNILYFLKKNMSL